jgi:hypothetical protein
MKTVTLENHARDSFGEAYRDARDSLIAAGYVKKTAIPARLTFSLEQALDLDRFPISVDRDRDYND